MSTCSKWRHLNKLIKSLKRAEPAFSKVSINIWYCTKQMCNPHSRQHTVSEQNILYIFLSSLIFYVAYVFLSLKQKWKLFQLHWPSNLYSKPFLHSFLFVFFCFFRNVFHPNLDLQEIYKNYLTLLHICWFCWSKKDFKIRNKQIWNKVIWHL